MKVIGSHFLFWLLLSLPLAAADYTNSPPLRPTIEVQEDVYSFEPADNGSGPLWCSGSTCLVRLGQDVFASGIETIRDCPPLNNCRWMLFARGANGWERKQVDPIDRTREPCPLACFADGRLFLSANPTLRTNREPGGGLARPQILEFDTRERSLPYRALLPLWENSPQFTEHSYRSLAGDPGNHELILFQNIEYTHAEWSFLDRNGTWSAHGKLVFPWGADYEKPQRIRVCYPNVLLQNRAVYFCGVSDIVEPKAEWRAYKKQLTGQNWDYDFRRLFFTWTPDIRTGRFHDWIELASRDQTCGWISPGDLWVASDGGVHIIWSERALDERLRDKFYPGAQQSYAINYALVRDGKINLRRTLIEAGQGGETPSAPRFQITRSGRLVLFYYVSGKNAAGQSVSENRVLEILDNGNTTSPIKVPLASPFTGAFTATVRGGSPPSDTLELLGHRAGKPLTVSYARIRLF
jgi:hypothetical protein